MLVEHIISERYVNAVGNDDQALAIKQKYVDDVWDILQQSYAPIGGIKGKGFESPEDMLSIPMWKLGIRDGEVRAVALYKDKGGRKAVAIGTDGSPEGAWFVSDIYRNELSRSYGEKSKAALGKMMKTVPWDVLKNFVISPDRVQEMMPDDRIMPISEVPKEDWPTDAKITLDKYPQLIDYGYIREIGEGNLLFKVMFGTPGKTIR